MKIAGTSKAIWLWLRVHGGHWTVHDLAQRTGFDADAVFTCVHAMSRERRRLVEQVPPAPGDRRKRYGVTDDCTVPLGLTVREASTGCSKAPAVREEVAPRIDPQVPAYARESLGLNASERAYAHLSHRLVSGSSEAARGPRAFPLRPQ